MKCGPCSAPRAPAARTVARAIGCPRAGEQARCAQPGVRERCWARVGGRGLCAGVPCVWCPGEATAGRRGRGRSQRWRQGWEEERLCTGRPHLSSGHERVEERAVLSIPTPRTWQGRGPRGSGAQILALLSSPVARDFCSLGLVAPSSEFGTEPGLCDALGAAPDTRWGSVCSGFGDDVSYVFCVVAPLDKRAGNSPPVTATEAPVLRRPQGLATVASGLLPPPLPGSSAPPPALQMPGAGRSGLHGAGARQCRLPSAWASGRTRYGGWCSVSTSGRCRPAYPRPSWWPTCSRKMTGAGLRRPEVRARPCPMLSPGIQFPLPRGRRARPGGAGSGGFGQHGLRQSQTSPVGPPGWGLTSPGGF